MVYKDSTNNIQIPLPPVTNADFYLNLIDRFAITLLGKSTLDDIFWLIAHNTMADLEFEDCVIYLVAEDGKHLIQKAAYGPKNPAGKLVKDPILIPMGEGIVGSVAYNKHTEIVPDTRLDKRYIIDDDSRLSEITVPILYENRCIGVIDSEHSQLDFYTPDHAQILTTIANMASAKIADAIKTEELHKTVNQLEISQRKLIEQTAELIAARNAEQAANKAKSEFLSTMSHEIRTPMNSIIGMADLLGIDENLDEVQSQKIDILKKAGFTLLHLINQILDLTKLDAREVLLEETEVHLLNLVKEVTSFAHQGDARDREPAIIEIKPILPEIITIDAAQLKKILLALLSNAFKFSNHGKVYLTLDLGSWQPRHTLILTIKDHGIGINKSDLEAIFKPFIQADGSDTRRYSGTGLGLAITQHVCHLMDGEITVESELGKGTTFTVQLPFK